jgi:hypothetical protein
MKFPRLRNEWMVGALVGVISGYYIFNDIVKEYSLKERQNIPKMKDNKPQG